MPDRSNSDLNDEMHFDRFAQILTGGVKSIALSVDERQLNSLYIYFCELKKWSKKINLIARDTGDEEIIEKHFVDSLSLLHVLQEEEVHLLDVGTGAGFPGLVCKAARPELGVTLVEPRVKRVSFLKHIVRQLALDGVEIKNGRIEDERLVPSSSRFTHAVSRAVNEIGPFCKMLTRFSYGNMQVVCMKGPRWQEELERTSSDYGITISQYTVKEFVLPSSGAMRFLITFEINNVQSG